ncbi:hypothetical protein DOT_5502 [Desulfosporosinus sp. OT]|nr:hypothetical protein DOT_5502 [Desulfosporosinus sp. OT]
MKVDTTKMYPQHVFSILYETQHKLVMYGAVVDVLGVLLFIIRRYFGTIQTSWFVLVSKVIEYQGMSDSFLRGKN